MSDGQTPLPMASLDPILQAEVEARRARPAYRSQSVAEVRASFRETQTRGVRGPEMAAVVETTLAATSGPLPLRIYRPANAVTTPPLVVYFHGGGHVIGDLDTHDRNARGLAAATGAVVASVAYRLAPEHPFPAGVEDAIDAARLASQIARAHGASDSRVFLSGDSAGATLAITAGLAMRGGVGTPVSGIIAFYPVVDQTAPPDLGSHRAFGNGKFGLSRDDIDWFRGLYLPDTAQRRDWRCSPALATDLSGLSPVVIVAAAYDPLRDEAGTFAARLSHASVPVTFRMVAGVNHGFMGAPQPPRAVKETLTFVAEWMATL